MRFKIRILDLKSKKTREIKKLKEYIERIGAKIAIFIAELGEECTTKELTAEEKLSKTGDFIVGLQQVILEFRRK